MQKLDAVGDRSRRGGDLHRIDTAVRRRADASRQSRCAFKVVHGEQNPRWHRKFSNGLVGKLAQSFHFPVTPLAAGFTGLRKPIELLLGVSGKLSSTLAAAACGEKCGISKFAVLEPQEEFRPLRSIAKPVAAQLDRP